MKRKPFILAGLVASAAVGLLSQTTQQNGGTYKTQFIPQEAGTLSAGGYTLSASAVSGVPAIAGRPFSATEETKTIQTLGDGTEISTKESRNIYRDVVGRTRLEQTTGGRKMVVIRDPEAGYTVRLDPEAKTAMRNMLGGAGRGGGVAAGPIVTLDGGLNALRDKVVAAEAQASGGTAPAVVRKKKSAAEQEDLGVQNINGVPALGTRMTQVIPVGQIGNNREIKVTNERWYSEDLQMVVKTVNSDPRFGTTTYELTNINRANPDVSLFQVPADYTVTEGGRGARGGAGGFGGVGVGVGGGVGSGVGGGVGGGVTATPVPTKKQ